DSIDDEQVRSIIKLGKRVERIDIYARMHMEKKEIQREVVRLNHRVERTGLKFSSKHLAHVNYLIEEDELDYDGIAQEIEALL
ncbi:MAG: hypothetical protein J6P60_06235, partial [Lachnospiraceae bacterium]|nr:hypothetical protein [Lachnospiraceae bacterium]